jgi:crossover junction endodeoxyribonuclease RuvC
MRIIGIDPGTAITGFGIINCQNGKSELIEAGVIRTPTKQALQLRLQTIYTDLTNLIKKYHPQHAAIEQLYFAKNVSTAISVSHARGVALLALANAGLEAVDYTPLQVKQALTGYGRAEKNQIQEMVKKLLDLKTLPKPDDAADALAVAICHTATISA